METFTVANRDDCAGNQRVQEFSIFGLEEEDDKTRDALPTQTRRPRIRRVVTVLGWSKPLGSFEQRGALPVFDLGSALEGSSAFRFGLDPALLHLVSAHFPVLAWSWIHYPLGQPAAIQRWAFFKLDRPSSKANRSVFLAKPR